jgi:hypothetical protein
MATVSRGNVLGEGYPRWTSENTIQVPGYVKCQVLGIWVSVGEVRSQIFASVC